MNKLVASHRQKVRAEAEQARLVKLWEKFPEGTDVVVLRDDGDELRTVTRSAPWLLGGHTAVIMVAGISGGFALDRVRLFGAPKAGAKDAWNPRYLAYCRAQGHPDPSAMLKRDEEIWRGGLMCGFILWTQAMWREWKAANDWPQDRPVGEAEHADFDKWLGEKTS